jgi:deoxyxylulose-5-phosphate synthase
MCDGTGLQEFKEKYPDRFFDVGIAEEHALTFAAGLAANGMRPVVAIYSTFLQRGFDNIIHDIALQKLPVTIMIDRAGLNAKDGPTHHGIFDVSFLSHVPNITIYTPITYKGLEASIEQAIHRKDPTAIRYPSGSEDESIVNRLYAHGDFENIGVDIKAAERCIKDIRRLAETVNNIVIVSDYIFSDAEIYDESTELFRKSLADIGNNIAIYADIVIEMNFGNATVHKGKDIYETIL